MCTDKHPSSNHHTAIPRAVNSVKYFKDIIKQSYGKKSEDGKRFIKDPKDFEEFAQTEAYVNLFMELATNSDAAANFVNGIIPQGLK